MENVIAALLREFEEGRTTRRQLIRNLAMAAVAAPAAGVAAGQAASATRAGQAPWKTVCLDHVSYAVADYKRSADFYTDLMGWEVRNDNGTSQASLDINGLGNIIIRNGRRRQDAPARAGGRPPVTGVINHISWGVQPWDTEAVRAELERRGLNPRPDMVGESFKSFHVRDPDGWDLQISNQNRGG